MKYESIISRLECEKIVEFWQISDASFFVRNSDENSGGKLLLKADVVELVHVLDQESDIIGCPRCANIMPMIHPATKPNSCVSCGFENLMAYDPKYPIFNQQIETPWRQPAIDAINSDYDNLAITVIRAEEHTAQINTARDEEEMIHPPRNLNYSSRTCRSQYQTKTTNGPSFRLL